MDWLIFFVPSLFIVGLAYLAVICHLRVPQEKTAVIYDRWGDAFVRFADEGAHWLKPWHKVGGWIDLKPRRIEQAHDLLLMGGLNVSTAVACLYVVDPGQLAPDLRTKLARMLPDGAGGTVATNLEDCLRSRVQRYDLHTFMAPGTRDDLQRQLNSQVRAVLAPMGLRVIWVKVGEIRLPRHISRSLEAAEERVMEARSQALALNELQEAVSQFTDRDMERLELLERLRVLGKNGVLLQLPTLMDLGGSSRGSRGDGRGHENGAGRPPTPPPSPWQPVDIPHH